MKLNERLQKIANEIVPGETMADIGSDHGFLPIYLHSEGICPHVIFSDISKGSLEKSIKNCKMYLPENDYDFRLGNGISVLKSAEVDNIVIAGMGGALISSILGENPELSHSFKKFILQPRNKVGLLRRWLVENGYSIVNEQLAVEGRFICVIITAEYAPELPCVKYNSDSEYEYPESLLQFRSRLTEVYLKRERGKLQKIAESIRKKSENPEIEEKSIVDAISTIDNLLKELNKNEQEQIY